MNKHADNLNTNLHAAKKVKNDEFYTKFSDVENELRHYKAHFKDKVGARHAPPASGAVDGL